MLLRKNLLLILSLTLATTLHGQSTSDDVCSFVGDIAVTSVYTGAFSVCMATGNPYACAIGYAALKCAENPACDGVVAKVTTATCTYIVSRTEDKIKIKVEGNSSNWAEIKAIYESLSTVEGVSWLFYNISP